MEHYQLQPQLASYHSKYVNKRDTQRTYNHQEFAPQRSQKFAEAGYTTIFNSKEVNIYNEQDTKVIVTCKAL